MGKYKVNKNDRKKILFEKSWSHQSKLKERKGRGDRPLKKLSAFKWNGKKERSLLLKLTLIREWNLNQICEEKFFSEKVLFLTNDTAKKCEKRLISNIFGQNHAQYYC